MHPKPTYHFFRRILATALIAFTGSPVFAQSGFTGIIIDAATKQVLPFATIKLGSTGQGMVTNLNGKFELKNMDKAEYLEISYLGYEPKKIPLPLLSDQETVIALNAKQGVLKEVVIKPP